MTFALIHLVAAPKLQGILFGLKHAWKDLGLDVTEMPVKSALCEARQLISYRFYEDAYHDQVKAVSSSLPRFRGFTIFATDGDQLELPAEQDVLDHGYRGYPCKDGKETHYPRMYYTAKTEVFSGIVVDVDYSSQNQECQAAVKMAKKTESSSVTLYDRLHFSIALARAHEDSKSYYVARCKGGDRVLLELQELLQKKRRAKRVLIDGLWIRFLRLKNPKTGEWMVLATNLPRQLFKPRELQWLYWRRYEIEGVFRDLTSNHSLGIWHSKKMNGILQEFFLHFWVHNAARFQVLAAGGIDAPKEEVTMKYRRPNFKLIREHFMTNIRLLVERKLEQFKREMAFLVKRSMETREWLSRTAPRQTKYTRNTYPSASLVPRRA
jgi:hypothetical protein